MERINTNVEQITIEIDGEEYAVAPKTVAVADQLMAVQRKFEGKMMYQLWLAELEVLLGKAAVKQLFKDGKNENIDRIQIIHSGVCTAFDSHARDIEAAAADRKAEAMEALARNLAPLTDLLKQVQKMQQSEGSVPQIHRP